MGAMTVVVVRRYLLETAGPGEVEERHDAVALDIFRELDAGVDDCDDDFFAVKRPAPLNQVPVFLQAH